MPLYHALSFYHRRRRRKQSISLPRQYANNIVDNAFLVLICPRLLRLKVIVAIIIGRTHAQCLLLRITCRLIHHNDSRQLACLLHFDDREEGMSPATRLVRNPYGAQRKPPADLYFGSFDLIVNRGPRFTNPIQSIMRPSGLRCNFASLPLQLLACGFPANLGGRQGSWGGSSIKPPQGRITP